MSASLLSIKADSDALQASQRKIAEMKKNLLTLIHNYLIENGYIVTATALNSEAGAVINKHCIADNMDLEYIVTEFEFYYEFKFGKKPKLSRKLSVDEMEYQNLAGNSLNQNKQARRSDKRVKSDKNNSKLPSIVEVDKVDSEATIFEVQGSRISNNDTQRQHPSKQITSDTQIERVLKPPPQFGGDSEMKQLAAVISREIYQESPNVRFDDIVDLSVAKRLLVEAVQLPVRFPAVFTGLLRPWRGILLHGPPGTGKTLLAKALATECQTTFFNISASTLVSKWRGESEKLVRALFDLARHYSPSTIFLDEIDSILSTRGCAGDGGEHEASRRMKTELLIQMDGVKGSDNLNANGGQVFVLAASNTPWDLDIALLRRLEKRVLVSLPSIAARETMIRKHLNERGTNLDYADIANRTDGYSGADIELVCREAAMIPLRRLMTQLQEYPSTNTPSVISISSHKIATKVATSRQGASTPSTTSESAVNALLKADPVTSQDLLTALATTRPSSDGAIDRYQKWQNEHGSV